MGRMVRLTKALYARLNKLARRQGGCPLRVRVQGQLPGDHLWAQVVENAWLYRKAGEPEKLRHPVIDLVNQFDLDLFHDSIRPELNYSVIPEGQAYEFLIWHEIGHLRQGIPSTFLIWGWLFHKLDPNLSKFLVEMQADRFAWRALFPDKPLLAKAPAPGNPTVAQINAFYDENRRVFEQYAKMASLKPLTTALAQMVPMEHVDPPGIPWA
jgi:hypothetical protein